jgi:tetratricopeptide (TPR) repeat protein
LELNNQSSYEGSRRAKDLFEQAIAIDPGFGRAYNGLAIARAIIAQHLGTDDAGAEEYGLARKAVEVGDADEETFATLAIHHLFRQEIEQMDACISQALGINAQNPMVVLWEGWILLQKGRYLDALDRAERICRLNPFPVPREYMFLGVANFMLGRHDEALRAFAHSEPSSYYHHYFRAAADAEAGRLEEGRRHMAEALRLRPQLSAQDRPAFHPFTADMTARFVAALRKVGLPEG